MSRRLYETMFSLPCPITESQRATGNGSLDKVRLVHLHRSGREFLATVKCVHNGKDMEPNKIPDWSDVYLVYQIRYVGQTF